MLYSHPRSLEAIGAHILLMCYGASSPEGYRIDADEYAIRMRLRNPSAESWHSIKRQLLNGAWKVSEDGKWWVQDGLFRTLMKQKEFSDNQRKKANTRWCRNDAESMPDKYRKNAKGMPDGMPQVCSSSSSSSSSSNLNPPTPLEDSDSLIEKLWRLYPGNRHRKDQLQIPPADLDPIILAVARDGGEVVTRGVEAFAKAVDTWPANERSYIPRLDKFFSESHYRKDPAEWQRNSKPTVDLSRPARDFHLGGAMFQSDRG